MPPPNPTGSLDPTPWTPGPTAIAYFDVLKAPQATYPVNVQETTIPGGTAVFLDVGGFGTSRVTFRLLVAEPMLPTLRALRGYRANLTYYLGTFPVLVLPLREGDWSWGTTVIDPTTGPVTTYTGLLYEVDADVAFL